MLSRNGTTKSYVHTRVQKFTKIITETVLDTKTVRKSTNVS